MRSRPVRSPWLVGLALGLSLSIVQAQVPPQLEKQIQKAAEQVKAQVAPKKARTVLIFNTPPSLMPEDPHRGYCIPCGEAAMKAIGVASGAFKPVVSDDIAMFAPENIEQFDDIVLNNASGPWITPTGADMEKESLRKLGGDAAAAEAVPTTPPPFSQFYLHAIQFAAGDLEAPAAPRADRPARKIPGTEAAPGMKEGFVSLFDGKTLDGWQGDPAIWSVKDGAITGRTTAETKLKENNFLVWKDEVEDFELRLKFRLENGNSGIYYRATKRPANQPRGDPLVGTQADFDASGRWTGVIMEYQLRDVLAERGQKVAIDERGVRQVVGAVGDPKKLLDAVKPGGWNDYEIRAKGGRVVIGINGQVMCELDDRDPKRLQRGWLAVQVHVGPPMLVQFKDIALRRL